MGLFDSFFGKKKNDLIAHTNNLSMDEMSKIQDSLKDKMSESDYNTRFNQACRLVPKGKYEEAIVEFEAVRANTTNNDTKGTCDNQIGVCYFFLGDFEKAITYYTSSFNHGFDKGMADDNIWEACEKLMSNASTGSAADSKKKWSQLYLSILPQGNYASKANKNL